jgi:hypothetical protein
VSVHSLLLSLIGTFVSFFILYILLFISHEGLTLKEEKFVNRVFSETPGHRNITARGR